MPGSVDSDQVIRLAGQSPKLMREIAAALKKAGTKLSAIAWTGARLGRQWKNLAGSRVAPYGSTIGPQVLILNGDLRFVDDEGKILTLDDPTVFDDAMFVVESRPSWKWEPKPQRKRR